MTNRRRIGDIPAADARDPSSLQRFLDAVREIMQVREGWRATDPLEKGVTFRDLSDLSLAQRVGLTWVGTTPGPVGPFEPEYVPDFTAPPPPANLAAFSTFRGVLVEWDPPTYTVGHGNAYTEVYVAQYGGSGALPTFSAATSAGKAAGATTMLMVPAAMGAQLHIWAKHVTNDGIESTPAGGTNGVQMTVGRVGNSDLGPLIVEAGNLASGAVTAAKLAAQAVGLTAFAAGIEPVTIVTGSTLPTTKLTETIYLTGTGKLYRWTGSAYTAAVPTSDLSGTISEAQIAANAVSVAKFASGIEPVTVVSSVPGSLATRSIFNTSDGKLYRWNGSAYVATVPTTDLTGTVSDAQIAGMAASKVTGQLSDSQLAAIAAAKVTGTLNASQLAVSIGGGNLLPNANFKKHAGGLPYGWGGYNNGAISATWQVAAGGLFGTNFVRVTANASTTSTLGVYTNVYLTGGGLPWTPGLTYVISYYARAAGSLAAGLKMQGLDSNMGFSSAAELSNPPLINGTWQRYVWRVSPADNTNTPNNEIYLSWYTQGGGTLPSGAAFDICAVQVEQGDMVTAFAPKPSEILPDTITATEIADNAITTPKLVAGAVVAGKIAANAVSATEIAAGAVTTAKLAAGAVTANEIAADTITAAKIASGTITATELAAGSVTTAKIAAGAVTATEIAAGTITGGKIAAGTITGSNIAADTITAGQIAAGAITADEIAANAIRTDKLLVTGRGAALNEDPGCQDPTAWQNGAHGDTASQVTISDGIAGSYAFRSTTGTASSIDTAKLYPVSSGKRYRLSAWVRRSSNANGVLYLRLVDQAGNQLTQFYEGATPTTAWVRLAAEFVPTNSQTSVRIRLILNWTGSAGYHETTDIRLEEKAEGDLIVDGAISTDKLAANAVTAGKIQAGAIGADQIAAGAIRTDKLLVTGRGEALNDDPNTQDVSAWLGSGLSIVTGDGLGAPSGRSFLRCASNSTVLSRPVAVDPAKNYQIRMWVRQASGSSKTYLTVAFNDENNANISGGAAGWPSTGTYFYFGLIEQTPSATWTEYRISFGPGEVAKIPAGAKTVQVGLLANFSGGAGVQDINSVRLMLKADADLIVDGAIIAGKLAAGAIAVGSAAIQDGAIRNALIENLAVDDAKIANLAVGKLTAGSLKVGDFIQSTGYVAGSQGWRIHGNGGAEFAFAMIRGTLSAAQVAAGSITADKIDSRGLTIKDASGNVVFASGSGSAISASNNSLRVQYPGGGALSRDQGNSAGAIWIIPPQAWTNTMLRFEVEIYEYDSGSLQTYEIGGYTYQTGQWINVYATYRGTPSRKRRVAFGYDNPTGRPCIAIGAFAGVWQYPKVTIKNLLAGYLNFAESQWSSGWSVTLETSRSYSEQVAFENPTIGGAFSGLDQINSSNVSTYIASAAIGWAQIGDLVINTGGGVRSGKTAYGSGTGWLIEYNNGTPRLDIGDANQYLRWTGTALDIKLNKITLTGTTPSGGSFPKNDTITRSLGTCTITASGGTPPYAYSWIWSADVQIREYQARDPDTRGYASFSSNVATFTARGDNDCIVTVFASCTVTDQNGLAAVFDTAAAGTFGSGVD